ncbi:MAG: chorismate mutase [Proteobacteria bacterium]|nr:chorismate mutase [Pseudomonadota bacterium]
MSSGLKEIRGKIDKIDVEILNLLEKRFKLAMRTRKLKRKTTDTGREKEIIEKVLKRSGKIRLLSQEFTKKIFKLIISESKKNQQKKTTN